MSQDVVVNYETIDGTARAGVDYVATRGSLVIPAGQTSAVVSVPTLEGGTGTRSFTLAVTDPYFGVEADAEGTGTIAGDQAGPLPVSVQGVAVTPRFTG